MRAYVGRRFLLAVPVLFGITIIAFAALSAAPGDPLVARLGGAALEMTQTQLDAFRESFGLNDSVPVQYAHWLGDVIQGDLGFSAVTLRPVADEITSRIGPTLLLSGTSIVVAIVVGVPLGVLAAIKQYRAVDHTLTAVATLLISIPGFVVALVGIYFFAVTLGWLPASGMNTLGEGITIGDLLRHMIMPVAVTSTFLMAQLVRYTRAAVLDVLRSDYNIAARARGLPPRKVIAQTLRLGIVPVITIIGLALPNLVGGAVIVETVFAWPGMGQLAVNAALNRDPSLMMGVILVIGSTVLVANIIVDIAYAAVDPRIRL